MSRTLLSEAARIAIERHLAKVQKAKGGDEGIRLEIQEERLEYGDVCCEDPWIQAAVERTEAALLNSSPDLRSELRTLAMIAFGHGLRTKAVLDEMRMRD